MICFFVLMSLLIMAGCKNKISESVNKVSAQNSLESAADFYDRYSTVQITYVHERSDGQKTGLYTNKMITDRSSGITHSEVFYNIKSDSQLVYEEKEDIWYYDNKNGIRNIWSFDPINKCWKQYSKPVTSDIYSSGNIAKEILKEYKNGNVFPEAKYANGTIQITSLMNLPDIAFIGYSDKDQNIVGSNNTEPVWNTVFKMDSLHGKPLNVSFINGTEKITIVYNEFDVNADLNIPVFQG